MITRLRCVLAAALLAGSAAAHADTRTGTQAGPEKGTSSDAAAVVPATTSAHRESSRPPWPWFPCSSYRQIVSRCRVFVPRETGQANTSWITRLGWTPVSR